MNSLLRELELWGCDVDGAMNRFLNDQSLYENCLRMLAEDSGFQELKQALLAGDVKAAFDSAHTLKGVIANMGLTPMSQIIVNMVETLRAGNICGLMPSYEKLALENEHLKQILKS